MKIFFITFFIFYGIINFYFFIKLKSAFNLKWKIQVFIAIFLIFAVFSPLIIRIVERQGYETTAIWISWIGYLWMAFVVLFLFFGVLTDIGRFFIYVTSKIFGQSIIPVFQRLPKNIYFIVPFCLSSAFLIYGYFEALNIRTERITIQTDKINKNLRIVQISDVHVGLIVREQRIKKIVEKIKEVNPDIIVSTGDLVDAQIDKLNHIAEIFNEIKPYYGKFAITGNHEFYAGLNNAILFTERAGFEILRGKGKIIDELNINIVGLDDLVSSRYNLNLNIDSSHLLRSFSNKRFTILLKHRPIIDRELLGLIDLQLSGHTHKGQFFPFNLVTSLYYRNNDSGLIKINDNSYLYVSRGTGTWGPPVRIFAPPEITVIDLIKKQN